MWTIFHQPFTVYCCHITVNSIQLSNFTLNNFKTASYLAVKFEFAGWRGALKLIIFFLLLVDSLQSVFVGSPLLCGLKVWNRLPVSFLYFLLFLLNVDLLRNCFIPYHILSWYFQGSSNGIQFNSCYFFLVFFSCMSSFLFI